MAGRSKARKGEEAGLWERSLTRFLGQEVSALRTTA